MHRIRYIAVHEDLSGFAVAYSRFRDATVCATDPEDVGSLTLGEKCEGVGVEGCGVGAVGCVAGEEVREGFCVGMVSRVV